ncbi:LysR family transcriptional regulator [Saccharopolyspora shandongensis]|uniref:LysR family transcriptional regulator n=1 Tax=Saccharopolyspora shandongensis TaxID=418495 RepID=UPI0034376B18
MRYDLVDLRLFSSIVAEGSITAGAEAVHLSLASASARVRSLEQHAGMTLLVRERRGVRPTPAGAALARHAREVLASTARLDGAVTSYARASTTPLVLLAGTSAMHRLVPKVLSSFLTDRANVDVVVHEHHSARSVQILVNGEADLGIVLESETRDSGLDVDALCDDSLVVIGSPGGVLAGRRSPISFAEVAEHPMVGLNTDSSLQRTIATNLDARGPTPRYRTLVPSLRTVVALAAAGMGLAIVPRRAITFDRSLDICDLNESWAHRRLVLAWGAATDRSSPTAASLAESIYGAT